MFFGGVFLFFLARVNVTPVGWSESACSRICARLQIAGTRVLFTRGSQQVKRPQHPRAIPVPFLPPHLPLHPPHPETTQVSATQTHISQCLHPAAGTNGPAHTRRLPNGARVSYTPAPNVSFTAAAKTAPPRTRGACKYSAKRHMHHHARG